MCCSAGRDCEDCYPREDLIERIEQLERQVEQDAVRIHELSSALAEEVAAHHVSRHTLSLVGSSLSDAIARLNRAIYRVDL